jgi:ABC-type antimicrobial peptide transport system permease subunit
MVRQGLALVLVGWAIGVITALVATQLSAHLFFGVSPTDASAFVVASMTIVAVGIMGIVVPAIRAVRIAPGEALRYD